MQIRLISAVCVIAAGTMCGRALAWSSERRCRLLENFIRAIGLLRTRISDRMISLDSALNSCGSEVFSRLARELESGQSLCDAWESLCQEERKRGGEMDSLTDADTAVLNRLFQRLGQVGRKEQDETIGSCIGELNAALSEARANYAVTGKTYTSVGFLCSLGVVILMI